MRHRHLFSLKNSFCSKSTKIVSPVLSGAENVSVHVACTHGSIKTTEQNIVVEPVGSQPAPIEKIESVFNFGKHLPQYERLSTTVDGELRVDRVAKAPGSIMDTFKAAFKSELSTNNDELTDTIKYVESDAENIATKMNTSQVMETVLDNLPKKTKDVNGARLSVVLTKDNTLISKTVCGKILTINPYSSWVQNTNMEKSDLRNPCTAYAKYHVAYPLHPLVHEFLYTPKYPDGIVTYGNYQLVKERTYPFIPGKIFMTTSAIGTFLLMSLLPWCLFLYHNRKHQEEFNMFFYNSNKPLPQKNRL